MKVKLKLCPLDRVDEEKITAELLSEVIVCGAESWFVQVTLAPTLIVTELGMNAKFWIVIDVG
jgi:hypothetical protein